MISFDFYNTDSEFAFSLTLDSDSRGLQFVELSPNQTIGTVVEQTNNTFVSQEDSELITNYINNRYDSDYFTVFVDNIIDSEALRPVADELLISIFDSDYSKQILDSEHLKPIIRECLDSDLISPLLDSERLQPLVRVAVDSEIIRSVTQNLWYFEADSENPDPVLSDFDGGIIFIGQY